MPFMFHFSIESRAMLNDDEQGNRPTPQVWIMGRSVLLIATLSWGIVSPSMADEIEAEVLLRGGQVIDGSGSPARAADIAIVDGKIELPKTTDKVTAPWTIDCSGLVICPGFIDLHNHSDGEVEEPETRAAMNYVTQGCTTMVTGNCGSGPIKVGEYYDKIDAHGAGTNIAHLIPQGGLRKAVLDSERVEPTDAQMREMRQIADAGMREGAWGMSTGLIYVPSSFASTEEITEIASVVAKHG
ncbi:MAG: amidohydrolase family protein, partial [Rubripirellula sp.]